MKKNVPFSVLVSLAAILVLGITVAVFPSVAATSLLWFVFAISTALTLQSLFTIYTMIYTWNNPEAYENHKSPTVFVPPFLSFSAIVPARHEAKVIGHTIRAINNIRYPEALKELVLVVRNDDEATIRVARETIEKLQNPRLKLVISERDLKNKPMSLNVGLHHATGDIVVVFDAEDEPHPDVYNAVHSTFVQTNAEVVQSGVQLMDYRSSWYATLNVLEYFFWFKSVLHFFASVGAVPLAGNTVFFKRNLLETAGGWDENLLTEDADIGMRLSRMKIPIKVIYDADFATREETPPTLKGLIKQRTRWNQGFLQLLFQGKWLSLPTMSQKIFAGYILATPILQALWLSYIPFSLVFFFFSKLPITVALYSFIPLYLLLFQCMLYGIGLFIFTRDYRLHYPFWMPVKILFTLFPFQLVLGWSSLIATQRFLDNNAVWEKTEHTNAHRSPALVEG